MRMSWQRISQEIFRRSPYSLTSELRFSFPFLICTTRAGKFGWSVLGKEQQPLWSTACVCSRISAGDRSCIFNNNIGSCIWVIAQDSTSWRDVSTGRKGRAWSSVPLSFTSTQTLLIAPTLDNRENPIQGCTDKSPFYPPNPPKIINSSSSYLTVMEKYTWIILELLGTNWLMYIFNHLFNFAVLGITHRTNTHECLELHQL